MQQLPSLCYVDIYACVKFHLNIRNSIEDMLRTRNLTNI